MTGAELTEEIRAEAFAFIAVEVPALPELPPDIEEWIEAGIYFGMSAAVLVLQRHGLVVGGEQEE